MSTAGNVMIGDRHSQRGTTHRLHTDRLAGAGAPRGQITLGPTSSPKVPPTLALRRNRLGRPTWHTRLCLRTAYGVTGIFERMARRRGFSDRTDLSTFQV